MKYLLSMKHLGPIAALLIAGCGPYEVKVNENTLYTPPPTVVAELADAALRQCVTRALEGYKAPAVQLRTLDCAGAGVASLVGIGAFERLVRVNLADNDLIATAELASLPALEEVDLSGNDDLPCASIRALPQRVAVTPPQHCR